MRLLKNTLVISLLMVLLNFSANLLAFTYNYNRLATPFLHEEQRLENADFIISTTSVMFTLEALLVGVIFFEVLKWHEPRGVTVSRYHQQQRDTHGEFFI